MTLPLSIPAARVATTASKGTTGWMRSYKGVASALHGIAGEFPEIARLQRIGSGSSIHPDGASRTIYALELGARSRLPADAKTVVLVGGMHARETANPTLLANYAEELARGYGVDAQITNLLDNNRVSIIPLVNVDGYALAEDAVRTTGNGGTLPARFNANGVDLNRDFPAPGTTLKPFKYPGEEFELETRALLEYLRSRPVSLLADVHSFGQLNLHMGDSPLAEAITRRMSEYNGYRAISVGELYPGQVTKGSLIEWISGQPNATGVAVETGTQFHPTTPQEFERVSAENKPVFDYLISIGRDPASLAKGPAIRALTHSRGHDATTLTLASSSGVQQAIDAIELLPGTPGEIRSTVLPAHTLEGAPRGEHTLRIPNAQIDALAGSRGLIRVRAKSHTGAWGPETAVWSKPV